MTGRGGGLAWLDGALVPREQAAVSIDDFGYRYGAACFETMLARAGRVFRLDAHLARLHVGLAAMGVEPPRTEVLRAAVAETLRANGLAEAQVRLTVSAGRGPGPDLAAARGPGVLVTAAPPPDAPPPASLAIVGVEVDERRPLAAAKTANFLTYLLARAEARRAGADDALLLNHAGAVCEAATANVFAVLDGVLVTPPLADGPLPGVTRAAVLECARAEGVRAEERRLLPADLARASEAFLTSSVAGVRPVVAVEGRGVRAAFAPKAGPVTSRLRTAYEALVRAECEGAAGLPGEPPGV